MKKIKQYKYHLIALLVVLIVILADMYKPKKLNWFPSYTAEDKIPFGTYILYNTLSDVFPNQPIISTYYPPYNTLKKDSAVANYLFINRNISFSKFDLNKLMPFAYKGGNVFLAGEDFNWEFLDTFNIKIHYYIPDNERISLLDNPDTISYNFTAKPYKRSENYYFKKDYLYQHFTSYDTTQTEVLGINSYGKPNFIRIKHGKGYFYINLLPQMFTNYQLADTANYDYAYHALSYLPANNRIIWDENFKIGKRVITSPLRFILTNKPLRNAYYLLLFLILLFFVFEAKRKQRIIPEISPPTNATMEFIDVMGRLYFNNEPPEATAQKKLYFWMNYIRLHYKTKPENSDESIHKIAQMSGVKKDLIIKIFSYKDKPYINEKELITLHTLLTEFYKTKKK